MEDIFLILSEHKRQNRSNFVFLKRFLEKKYVLELSNTFFFEFCPTLEVNNRTIGDNNGTIEQTTEQFYEFFHCLMIQGVILTPLVSNVTKN